MLVNWWPKGEPMLLWNQTTWSRLRHRRSKACVVSTGIPAAGAPTVNAWLMTLGAPGMKPKKVTLNGWSVPPARYSCENWCARSIE
jgi:hypothetical protein